MPVKHWSFAGLILTYWCSARCASCYVCAGPDAGPADDDMTVETGLALWEGLTRASPHGCRIHIGGGEPFGRWETLIELCRRARAAGLGPLEAVETNAYWAGDDGLVRDRLRALDAAGLGRLDISADPYHQQFVPIERPRRLAATAAEILGDSRVRVRWRDWLAEGFDTGGLDPPRMGQVLADWLARRRERLNGRAAAELADLLELKPLSAFADEPCRERLLRSRHVHADGAGRLCPGTCAGIVLAQTTSSDGVAQAWQTLARKHEAMPVVAALAAGGPTCLARQASALGYVPRPEGYAGRCHLCWHVRRWLWQAGHFRESLGPARVYE